MGYLAMYEKEISHDKEIGNFRKLMTSSAEKFLISTGDFT